MGSASSAQPTGPRPPFLAVQMPCFEMNVFLNFPSSCFQPGVSHSIALQSSA